MPFTAAMAVKREKSGKQVIESDETTWFLMGLLNRK